MRVAISHAAISFGRRDVFSHLSATIEPSQITTITGPSGSGKSSLLAAIGGYLPLTSGHITITDSLGRTVPEHTSITAWVTQGTNALPHRSVLDNVMMGSLSAGEPRQRARERAHDLLATVRIAHLATFRAKLLSGGELQRLALARALATNRPLLLADEPSSSLDLANTLALAEILRALSTTATIIIATHDPVLVASGDATIDIRDASEHRET
ncbi:ATP-binding cassette domain-containing protein [Mycetocola tolaasinivorans]|uniref:ATP-binding cassette domain-containing protein n=1 Tax=Mycetocola tolaasinivorans TaxID=76635 RepID=A0A3L7A6L1_9MICO|nr:ATP-binding cassette domain-containing protein [Mycetocola tolaasinivorans]RLP75966.1 ATP-binding cassette domain-containing protein [Mycetocola tolaasinivorans]